MDEVLRCNVLNGKLDEVEVKSFSGAGKIVAIYFSAHWCPPCRGFTPQLAEYYHQMKADGKQFEVVFVSADKDQASFKAYFAEMPWLAVPFTAVEEKKYLNEKYGITGIPTLVIVNGETVSDFQPHSHLPFSRSGNYSDVNVAQYAVINGATNLVLKAADGVPFKGSHKTPFVICDLATADGGISMPLMRKLIGLLKKKYGDDQCIQILYEDQASNDFNTFFKTMYGPDSYVPDFTNIYVSACGTNFYNQCFPPESVHFGFSSTAMHYLYQRPCCLTESLQQSMCIVPEERKCFAEHAARDWETILLHRAAELAYGGQLVIVCSAIDDKGQYLGNTERVKESLFQQFTQLWKSMLAENKITREEFVDTTFNTYYRNEEEFKAPLVHQQSPVYKAGLRLVSIETKAFVCPRHKDWAASGKSPENREDARAHAKCYVQMVRFWSNCVFRAGLSDKRPDEEKDDLVEEFFQRYEAIVAKRPQDHAMDAIHVYVHIEKVQYEGDK